MTQIDKEAKRQKSKIERNKVAMERKIPPRVKDYEEDSSSSSMSMYNLDSNGEDLEFSIKPGLPLLFYMTAPLPMHMEEVHSSPITEKSYVQETLCGSKRRSSL